MNRPAPAILRGKRAAVLLFSYYPSDTRPRRAAAAMVEAGMEVDLLCLTEKPEEPREEMVDGVRVFRLARQHSRGSKLVYLKNYATFIAASFFFLLRRGFRRRYDVVHVHNMPDILVFAAVLEKLRGARVLLDLHDPMPELMMSIYGLKAGEWPVRLLKFFERCSIRFASEVITTNVAFRTLFTSRNAHPEKIHIVMNCPDGELYDPARFEGKPSARPKQDGQFRLMHHGAIVHRHGVDLLVEAVARLRPQIPQIHLDIYGPPTAFLDDVLALARERGVADVIKYHGNKTEAEIAWEICETDLGVIPNRRSAFTELNFPTRIFEYLAMGRLVVSPATPGISDYFSPQDLPMFEQNNVDDLVKHILWARQNPPAAQTMLERGQRIYWRHMWSEEKARFLELVANSVKLA